MAANKFLKRHGIVRNAIRKDIFFFAIPAITIWSIELLFCARDVVGLAKQQQNSFLFSVQGIIGGALFFIGLIIMIVSQATLWRNYSSTLVIREDHQLITHGIYRFTRNPIYLGVIIVAAGIPVFAASLYGFLSMLFLIPVFLIRIRLEERLLTEEFEDTYRTYKKNTRKLIPLIY